MVAACRHRGSVTLTTIAETSATSSRVHHTPVCRTSSPVNHLPALAYRRGSAVTTSMTAVMVPMKLAVVSYLYPFSVFYYFRHDSALMMRH